MGLRDAESVMSILGKEERKPTTYRDGTVSEIKGDTAYVDVDGGAKKTPCRFATSAKIGDKVQVQIDRYSASIVGNYTSPATNDEEAKKAREIADEAYKNLLSTYRTAESAEQAAIAASEAAGLAQSQASIASTQASIAAGAARDASTAARTASDKADEAIDSARTANTAAIGALNSLSDVEKVVGTANWISQHRTLSTDTVADPEKAYYILDVSTDTLHYVADINTYSVTADTEPQTGKTYYIIEDGYYVVWSGTEFESGVTYYERTGVKNPSSEGWYELDRSVQNYIASHLAETDYGLNLMVDNSSLHMHLGTVDGTKMMGTYIIDELGNPVGLFAEKMVSIGDGLLKVGEQLDADGYTERTFTFDVSGTEYNIGDSFDIGSPDPEFFKAKGYYMEWNADETSPFFSRLIVYADPLSVEIDDVELEYGVDCAICRESLDFHDYYQLRLADAPSSGSDKIVITFRSADIPLSFAYGHGISSGNHSVAFSYGKASGDSSFAENQGNANGYGSHSEGCSSTSGNYSHSEGYGSHASGHGAHAEGGYFYQTPGPLNREHYENGGAAYGNGSHAEGIETESNGVASHSQNYHTIASGNYQTAIGKYNVEDANNEYAFIIGNGSYVSSNTRSAVVDDPNEPILVRSNALAVKWNGLIDINGSTDYPIFFMSSFDEYSSQSSLPVTPCFVYDTTDNALWECSGTVPAKLVSGYDNAITKGIISDCDLAQPGVWSVTSSTVNGPASNLPGTLITLHGGLADPTGSGLVSNMQMAQIFVSDSRIWTRRFSATSGTWKSWAGFVNTAGDTMTGALVILDDMLHSNSTVIDIDGSRPSSNQYRRICGAFDKDGEIFGYIEGYRYTNGNVGLQMVAHRKVNGSDVYNVISAMIDESGNKYYVVDDPANFRSAIGAVNKAGDTMTGDLYAPCIRAKSGNYQIADLLSTSEGGKVRFYAPDGSENAIDAYNNIHGRIYNFYQGNYHAVYWSRDRNINLDDIYEGNIRASWYNSYWGFVLPGGGTADWLRTTLNGLIPYASGGSGSLGTSSWPFNSVYAQDVWLNGGTLAALRTETNGDRINYMSAYTYLHISTWSKGNFGVTWWSSDIRLKENIEDSDVDALAIVNQIQHRSFDMKRDGEHHDIGYIAQELEKLDPQMVTKVYQSREVNGRSYFTGDYTYQVDERKVIPYLSKSIQQLSAENGELKAKNAELEARLEAIERKLGL